MVVVVAACFWGVNSMKKLTLLDVVVCVLCRSTWCVCEHEWRMWNEVFCCLLEVTEPMQQ